MVFTSSMWLCVAGAPGFISWGLRTPYTTLECAEAWRSTRRKKRPDSVPGGLGISPDAIDFKRRVVIERKGSAKGKEAVSRQALFYAAFMTGATGEIWKAEVQVYGSRKKTEYNLTEPLLDQLIRDAEGVQGLMSDPPPAARRIPLCRSCSCNVLCWEG